MSTTDNEMVASTENGHGGNHNGTGLRSRTVKSTSNGEDIRTREAETTTFYYGGPRGALFLMIAMPLFLCVVCSMCNETSCTLYQWPQLWTQQFDYFNLLLLPLCIIAVIVLIVLSKIPLGPVLEGELLQDGRRVRYLSNGIPFLLVIFAIAGILIFVRFPFTIVSEHFLALVTYGVILSFAFSVYLYLKSFHCPPNELSIYGNTGNVVYDFFMGREANPRLFDLDIKLIIQRLGKLFLCLIDLSLVAKQVNEQGSATPTLLISAFGHALLMLDHFLFEENILTSHTMKYEGTGFLYVFYTTIITSYLAGFNVIFVQQRGYKLESEAFQIFLFGSIVASHIFYRFSNSDKSLFLRYPEHAEVINYEYIPAIDNKRILVDGWWTFSRHPNYLAEILTALSWCVVTGIEDPLAYTYILVLVPFLLYRISMNEEMCRREFGDEAWDTYCQRVPYKLMKYVY